MKALSTWTFILNCLEEEKAVILLYVVDSLGSSPGRKGFMMAVSTNDMSGSIGGGIMEHKFVEMAKERLQALSSKSFIKKQIHNKSAQTNQSGMICSGEQTVLFFNLSENHVEVIEKIIRTLSTNKRGILTITPNEIGFTNDDLIPQDVVFSMESESQWEYRERLGIKNILYVIGGGHCSLALSQLMRDLDFYIILFEVREKLNTLEKNLFVHERKIIKDYSELENLIVAGENVYVVIMTFGYRTDDVALRSVIHKNFNYLGVLGSKAKMTKMFDEWKRDGLPEEKLNNVFAPIGLSINSRTPFEIAISIAAEIVKVKNG